MSATDAPADDRIHAVVYPDPKCPGVEVYPAEKLQNDLYYRHFEKLILPGCVLYARQPLGDPARFPSDLPDRLRELERLWQAMDTTPRGRDPKGPVRRAHRDYERALAMELAGTPLRRSSRLAGATPVPATLPAWGARADILLKRRKDAAAEEVGRKVNTLYPRWPAGAGCSPTKFSLLDFEALLPKAHSVIQRILTTGDNGRFRALWDYEARLWKYNTNNIAALTSLILYWIATHDRWKEGWVTEPARWDEEQVEIALRQHAYLVSLIEAAMK